MSSNGIRPTEFKLIRDWIDLQVDGKEFRSADVARDTGLVSRKIGHILNWQTDIVKHSRDRVGRIYKKVSQ